MSENPVGALLLLIVDFSKTLCKKLYYFFLSAHFLVQMWNHLVPCFCNFAQFFRFISARFKQVTSDEDAGYALANQKTEIDGRTEDDVLVFLIPGNFIPISHFISCERKTSAECKKWKNYCTFYLNVEFRKSNKSRFLTLIDCNYLRRSFNGRWFYSVSRW